MKKVFLVLAIALGVVSVNAQDHFKAGDVTLSGQATGLDFRIKSIEGVSDSQMDLTFGIDGSYFVIDNLAVTAGVLLQSYKFGSNSSTNVGFTIGARYYVYDALFAGVAYEGIKPDKIDLINSATFKVGYSYYFSDKVFFEPALFFNKGFGDFNKTSTFGLSIGIGINL